MEYTWDILASCDQESWKQKKNFEGEIRQCCYKATIMHMDRLLNALNITE